MVSTGVLAPSESLFAQFIEADRAEAKRVPELGEAVLSERGRLIDGIVHINPTATPEWLARFSDPALAQYLRHLEAAAKPRGREAVWVRTAETPALMGLESAA